MCSMQNRLQTILQRIHEAALQSGREPDSVQLLAVSKTHNDAMVQQAIALGLHRFGENRIQDIRQRLDHFADQPAQWIMIGHSQTNKAKDIARYAAELHSLDRLALAQTLDHRLQIEQRQLPVLIQVKTAQEKSKSGVDPAALFALLKEIQQYDTLQPYGLMTMATQTDDKSEIRRCFALLRQLRDQALQEGFTEIQALSMGMSNDFELAIAEGATEVRVGSALFGARGSL